MLCLLEMKAAEPGILFSTETDMATRSGEEGSICKVLLLYLFHLSLHQLVAVVVPTNLFGLYISLVLVTVIAVARQESSSLATPF
jgi:hypothetical protein